MEIIIYPISEDQTKAFEHLAKAFNIGFEIRNTLTPKRKRRLSKEANQAKRKENKDAYEAMLKESYQQGEEGKVTKITLGDLWI